MIIRQLIIITHHKNKTYKQQVRIALRMIINIIIKICSMCLFYSGCLLKLY